MIRVDVVRGLLIFGVPVRLYTRISESDFLYHSYDGEDHLGTPMVPFRWKTIYKGRKIQQTLLTTH